MLYKRNIENTGQLFLLNMNIIVGLAVTIHLNWRLLLFVHTTIAVFPINGSLTQLLYCLSPSFNISLSNRDLKVCRVCINIQ